MSEQVLSDEKIEFKSYAKCLEQEFPKYISSDDQEFTITNIRAIVIHQDENFDNLQNLVQNLFDTKKNPYHFAIESNGDIAQLNELDKALKHCRSKKYTPFANNYFGDSICPIFEDTDKTPHPEASPDNCTVSICVPKITTNVYNSLVKLCSYIINGGAKSLEATSNLLSAFEISDSFDNPKEFKENPEYYLRFKYDIEKKRSKWFVLYGGYKRGYPEVKIDIMDIK